MNFSKKIGVVLVILKLKIFAKFVKVTAMFLRCAAKHPFATQKTCTSDLLMEDPSAHVLCVSLTSRTRTHTHTVIVLYLSLCIPICCFGPNSHALDVPDCCI